MIWRPLVVGKRSSRVVFGRFWAEASGTTANASRHPRRGGDKKRHIRTNKLRCLGSDATAFLNSLVLFARPTSTAVGWDILPRRLGAAITPESLRGWPHSQDGSATMESQCDWIGRESRLRNSWSDVGIPGDPFTDAADLAVLPPFRFFFAGRSRSFTRDRRLLWSWSNVDCLFMTS